MSIGSWDPSLTPAQHSEVDAQLLARFVNLANEQRLDQLDQALSDTEQQQYAPIMQLPFEQWQQATETLDNQSLLALIRFFTKAEGLPGWEAGNKSPVIAITKILKSRGVALEKDLLLWIKSHSNNRFLPNGSLL